MKLLKILSVTLCFALCLSVVACNKQEDETPVTSVKPLAHSVNIVAYAEKGEIPEIPYKLGHSVDDLKETFMNHVESGSEITELIVDEGENDVWLDGGSVIFCYEKANKENGISVIIAKENAYDFSMGGVYDANDIIDAVGLENFERSEATDEDTFFLPVTPENCECIKYEIGDYVLRFILIDGYVSAVTLIDPNNWTYN
ncbi:MAG: hypothetical protein U0L55_07570 [Acutalibacteraceae bacterium]|nr:hypothetical protein [Acutalibacteraceae bacterium]